MSARPLALDAQQHAPLPASFGKYRVTRVLGEGAMGVVYEALDPDIHRNVAIKGDPQRAAGPEARDLDGEKSLPQRGAGRRPALAPEHRLGLRVRADRPQRYIAMEYVVGVSLHETVVHGFRPPLADTLSVIVQLLDALECAPRPGRVAPRHQARQPAAHRRGPAQGDRLRHRAHRRRQSHPATTVLGLPGYMAPERYTTRRPTRASTSSPAACCSTSCSPAARLPRLGRRGDVPGAARRTAAALDAAAGRRCQPPSTPWRRARDDQVPGRSLRRRGADARRAGRRRRRRAAPRVSVETMRRAHAAPAARRRRSDAAAAGGDAARQHGPCPPAGTRRRCWRSNGCCCRSSGR